jgi:hypothetical protein
MVATHVRAGRPGWKFGSSLTAAAVLLIGLESAWGQTQAGTQPGTSATEDETETVIVTGSRIARSGFTTPTPVTMLDAEQVARQGAANISQILNEIPAFRPQSTPSTTAIFVSNLGASTADLRGLGANRTLVLIDGRRVVASTVQGGSFTPANTVDLNLVPLRCWRAEVVTGGASLPMARTRSLAQPHHQHSLASLDSAVWCGPGGDTEEFSAVCLGHAFRRRARALRGRRRIRRQPGRGRLLYARLVRGELNTVSNPFSPAAPVHVSLRGSLPR